MIYSLVPICKVPVIILPPQGFRGLHPRAASSQLGSRRHSGPQPFISWPGQFTDECTLQGPGSYRRVRQATESGKWPGAIDGPNSLERRSCVHTFH